MRRNSNISNINITSKHKLQLGLQLPFGQNKKNSEESLLTKYENYVRITVRLLYLNK